MSPGSGVNVVPEQEFFRIGNGGDTCQCRVGDVAEAKQARIGRYLSEKVEHVKLKDRDSQCLRSAQLARLATNESYPDARKSRNSAQSPRTIPDPLRPSSILLYQRVKGSQKILEKRQKNTVET